MWKASLIFSTKSVFGYKVIKHLRSRLLNELVKLTMLWTTGPWFFTEQKRTEYDSHADLNLNGQLASSSSFSLADISIITQHFRIEKRCPFTHVASWSLTLRAPKEKTKSTSAKFEKVLCQDYIRLKIQGLGSKQYKFRQAASSRSMLFANSTIFGFWHFKK